MTDEEELTEEASPLESEKYWLNIQYALFTNRAFWVEWMKARILPQKSKIFPEAERKAARDLSAAIRGITIFTEEAQAKMSNGILLSKLIEQIEEEM